MIKCLFALALCFCCYWTAWSQHNVPLEGIGLYKVKGMPKFMGQSIPSDDPNDMKISVKKLNNDTVTFNFARLKKSYDPEKIEIYYDQKFHYQRSWVLETDHNFGYAHFAWDFAFVKQFSFPLEVGIGTGIHTHEFDFATSTDWVDVSVQSIPVYFQAKYKLFGNRAKVYLKGAFGIANTLNTMVVYNAQSGIYARGGAGMILATKGRFKHYFEFNQGILTASGTARASTEHLLSDIQFNNVQFIRFALTYGVQIGK